MPKQSSQSMAEYARGAMGMFALIGAVIGMLTLSIGFTGGYLYSQSKASTRLNEADDRREQGDFNDTFVDGWAAARQKIIDSGIIMNDVRIISGPVVRIGDGEITIRTELINPLDSEALQERTVVVTADTSIIRQRFADPGTPYADEVQAETLALADIAIGTMVDVQSLENIASVGRFNADTIIVRDDAMYAPTASPTTGSDVPPPPPSDDGNNNGDDTVPPPPPADDSDMSDAGDDVPPPPPSGDEGSVPPPPPPSNEEDSAQATPPPPPAE